MALSAHRNIQRNGVTKKLLWVEYCEECRQTGEDPLMYSQFCEYIRRDEQKRRATLHIPRKPGEQIEVGWAGDPACIIDPDTGEVTDCWLFVGVLTYSQYTFVEAFLNERTGNWIWAHVHMFEFFGGVTPMLVANNCATAVDHVKSDWYDYSGAAGFLLKSFPSYNYEPVIRRARNTQDFFNSPLSTLRRDVPQFT